MFKLVIVVITLAIGLSGCAGSSSSKLVILQDPVTMEFVNCAITDQWPTPESYAKNERCVEEYKKKGFTVWGER